MYGSIAELMANQPDFGRTTIPGGSSPFRQPVLPGEERFLPEMQEKLQPALPPVRKAATDLLNEYIGEIAQLAPKNLGYGFEADMQGMYTGGGGGPFIRGTVPEEQKYREGQYEQMQRRVGGPFGI